MTNSVSEMSEYYQLIWLDDHQKVKLYNLKGDIGEIRNLANEIPSKVKELSSMIHNWLKKSGAKLQQINPDFIPGN